MTDARPLRPEDALDDDARALTDAPIANDRFKRRWETWFWISTTVAIGVHFAVFALWPDMAVAVDAPAERRASVVVDVLPRIELPETPAEVRRPEIPVAGNPRISFDAPVDRLPLDRSLREAPIGPPPPASAPRDSSTSRFTPYEVGPVLRNEAEVVRTLRREYPPLLRASEIGGRVVVRVHVDVNGAVREAEVVESSGHDSMDAAALRVADTMEFSPALNRDRRVAVWVSLPITFRIRRAPAPPLGA